MPRLRDLRFDLLFATLGALVGAPSIGYPFGGDQGLYGYIGWEWLNGHMPYAQAFDMKTPGIYFVHLVSIALFGMTMWGIRLFDLLCTMALGWMAAEIGIGADEKPPAGVRGLGVFAACLTYFGFFDFWNTGQCESWCSMFAFASMLVVVRTTETRPLLRRAFAAGVLGGVALIFKPPAMWFVACTAILLAYRARSSGDLARLSRPARVVSTLGVHALGGLTPIALLVLHFHLRGAAGSMYELLVVNNRQYVVHGRSVNSARDVLDRYVDGFTGVAPYGVVIVIALIVAAVLAHRRGEGRLARRAMLTLALMATVLGGVTMQLKFVWYHWGLVVGPTALGAAVLARVLAPMMKGPVRAVAVVGVVFVALFALTRRVAQHYADTVANAADYVRGRKSRDDYNRFFVAPLPHRYSFYENDKEGEWLRARTKPDETVSVRGFAPAVYYVAQRRSPSRFFWCSVLVTKGWLYREQDWLEEDRRALAEHPPKFILAYDLDDQPNNIEASGHFYPLGYVARDRFFGFVGMEYVNAPLPPP